MTVSIDRPAHERTGPALPAALRAGVRVFVPYVAGRALAERIAPAGHADLVLDRMFRSPDVERVDVR